MRRISIALILVLFSNSADAAIALSTSNTTLNQFPGTATIVASITTGVGSDFCLVATVGIEDTTTATDVTVTSVPALTWTKVGTIVVTNDTDERVTAWIAVGAAASTLYAVTATADTATADYFPGLGVFAFTDVDQVTPQDTTFQTTSSTDAGMSSISTSITTATAGAMLVDVAALGGSGAGDLTPDTGQTDIAGTASEFGTSYELVAGAGAYTQGYTFTSPSADDRVVHLVLALREAGGVASRRQAMVLN